MQRHDTQLIALRTYDPDLTGTNLMVDSRLFTSYKPPPLLEKLSAPSHLSLRLIRPSLRLVRLWRIRRKLSVPGWVLMADC